LYYFLKAELRVKYLAMAAVASSSKAGNSGKTQQVQIRLKTIHTDFAVPDAPLSVPVSVDAAGLNNLIRSLLQRDDDDGLPTFDFIVADDLVSIL
jgi:hypothetical protein